MGPSVKGYAGGSEDGRDNEWNDRSLILVLFAGWGLSVMESLGPAYYMGQDRRKPVSKHVVVDEGDV